MTEFYKLDICGITRKLPITSISKNTGLASFNLLGDVELVDVISTELAKILKKYTYDYIVGPEVKVVPLIHEIAKKLNFKNYVICRKSAKPYMISPIVVKPSNKFPKFAKPLAIDGKDAQLLKGKRVAVVDNVISSGVTMGMMNMLMNKIGAEVVLCAVAVKQGDKDYQNIPKLEFLVEIPIFKKQSNY